MLTIQELLKFLACPSCKGPLVAAHDGTAFKCEKCRRLYKIVDGIPIMRESESTLEEP